MFNSFTNSGTEITCQAPDEKKRLARDGGLYTRAEFRAWYNEDGDDEWHRAAHEQRIGDDGKLYTRREFEAYYSDFQQCDGEWAIAAVFSDGAPYADSDHDYDEMMDEPSWNECPDTGYCVEAVRRHMTPKWQRTEKDEHGHPVMCKFLCGEEKGYCDCLNPHSKDYRGPFEDESDSSEGLL